MINPPLANQRLFWTCTVMAAMGSLLAIGFLELYVDYNREVDVWLPMIIAPLITVEMLALLLLGRYP